MSCPCFVTPYKTIVVESKGQQLGFGHCDRKALKKGGELLLAVTVTEVSEQVEKIVDEID